MPPRRTKAAGEDDGCPTLKLKIVKGLLAGQTSEFSPRSVIQIGRYVRGNTIAVKEPGVSSKHLRIQVETTADSGQRRWTITDLGSSNGTFLNGEELEEPNVLSDGDVIKIGEETSMIVELDGGKEIQISRTSARNNVKDQGTDLGVIDELGFEKKDLGINGVNKLGVVGTRRTRSSTKERGDIEVDVSVIEGRKSKKRNVVETIPEENVAEEMCSGKEYDLGSTSGVKGKMVADLETMSMGEWFDFLQVYLPQQIVERSEAKIAEMRQIAERLHKFRLQQKKLKD